MSARHYILPSIPGLGYIPSYISLAEHDSIIACVDPSPWQHDFQRRVQHYGYRYDYNAHRIDLSMRLGDLPQWAIRIAQRLNADGLFAEVPDQLIVNEYQPGQGIAPHIDCLPCFSDTVISISMRSPCVMQFTHPDGRKTGILLEPCSAVVLTGEARRLWQHAIPKRKSDRVDGVNRLRGRRVSLTFRKVFLDTTQTSRSKA
jgi:alkylated DNA repair dioxygenase AlkB